MGDMNINLLNSTSHQITSAYLDINLANGFTPQITKPNRITNHTASLIDNFFTNSEVAGHCVKAIIPCDISDHMPIIYVEQAPKDMTKMDTVLKKRSFYLLEYDEILTEILKLLPNLFIFKLLISNPGKR